MKRHHTINRLGRYLVLLFFLTPAMLPAQDGAPAMREYILGLIYKGENWQPNVPRIQAAHRANIDRLAGLGKLLVAGPAEDGGKFRGIFLYNTASMGEAREMVDSDPAVKAGQLRVELYSWWGPAWLEQSGD